MPELPEVETVRRGLEPVLEGARIASVEQRRPDLRFPLPDGFAGRLSQRRITAIGRRAKYLLLTLDDGATVICHLGMSGSFRIEEHASAGLPGRFFHERSKDSVHDHVVLDIDTASGDRARVIYNDPRRFGFMLIAEPGEIDHHPLLARLGVEPTGNSLDGAMIAGLFQGKSAPLKSALLDQRLIAGLGNIYVCEALWRAGLSPRRKAGSLAGAGGGRTARSERLADAIRAVLTDAIAAGGSSLRDYVHADGSLGYFQHSFSVYDREGGICPRQQCGGTIERIVQSGRSTFLCGLCQR
jgi:formamidopyrimidine-DNA glycosylase